MSRLRKSRRRVLFVAFPFPPSRGAGVYRTVAIANYLSARGWSVTVVAPEEDYFLRYQGSEDQSLLSWVSEKVDVARVPLTNWLREDDVGRMSLARVLAPKVAQRWIGRATRYLSPLDHYPFWFGPAFSVGIRQALKQRIDLIMATGNPFTSFAVASSLGKALKIPYVLDYRDAWTFDQFTGHVKPMASDTALALERRILHSAAGVVTVNEPIADWLRTNHAVPRQTPIVVVENGFDREFTVKSGVSRRSMTDDTLRFVHVGTLVLSKMDWSSMLGQFDRASASSGEPIRLDVYGHLGFSSDQALTSRQLFEFSDRIKYHGPVERARVAQIYHQADVLYLPLYDSRYVTSGKVYEMMATGKPILAWGSDEAGALVPLSGYPKLVRADSSNPHSWTRAISAASAMSKLRSPELDRLTREYASQFERHEQLKPLARMLERIVPSE